MTTGVSLGSTLSPRIIVSGVPVLLEVDEPVGKAVPRGELAEAARVRREARADDAQARPEFDQHRAAGQERVEEEVAEHGVLRDELAELLDGHRKDFALLDDHRGEERGLPGEQADLAQEPPRAVQADDSAFGSFAIEHGHGALEHHEELRRRLAGAEEDLAGLRTTGSLTSR